MIDTPEKSLDAGHHMRSADVDLIFLYVTTYAVSSTVLPVVQRAKVPVIILNLSPEAAIYYGKFNRQKDDGYMAFILFCLFCSRDSKCISKIPDSILPSYWIVER
jgi:L-arabinose isomerase